MTNAAGWCIISHVAALAQLDRVPGYEPVGRGFESLMPRQQKENFCLPKVLFLFIQAAGLAYHRRAKRGAYHQGRRAALVSHHAQACISLRLDDIQHFVLMICNSCGIDDIQGCALIYLQKCSIIYLKNYDLKKSVPGA